MWDVVPVSYTHLDVYKRQEQITHEYRYVITYDRIACTEFEQINVLTHIYKFVQQDTTISIHLSYTLGSKPILNCPVLVM